VRTISFPKGLEIQQSQHNHNNYNYKIKQDEQRRNYC
jgi:hypothetical protein